MSAHTIAEIGLIIGAIGVLIGVLAVTGVLVFALRGLIGDAVLGTRSMRRTIRASRRHKQERAGAHQEARAELVKLGEEIAALDIDSSMPDASARGKNEYSQAIDAYEEAERRLGDVEDDYQFERAVEALRRGREHVRVAGRLFNPSHQTDSARVPPDDDAVSVANKPRDQAEESAARIYLGTASSAFARPGVRPGGPRSVADELARLAALHERGALTDAEFDREKQKRLAR